MREFLDELFITQKGLFSNVAKLLAAFVIIVMFGVYIGNLLFGKDSVEVLIDLQNKKESLKHEVERLKEDNAKLQKEYFELKELEPQ